VETDEGKRFRDRAALPSPHSEALEEEGRKEKDNILNPCIHTM